MKIGPIEMHGATPAAAGERKAPSDAVSEAVSAAEPSAKVQLSSQVALAASDGSRADFDAEKVDRITQAIREGRFQVNAEAIADRLIANAQELLPKGSH